MEFTREQELAVRLRDKDILVSAGAGAGKTRVLISRMAEMILDENDPIPVDSFLVMTFTNAAADEMKERITEELNQRLERDPDNYYLRKQVRMIHHADIFTVHSFCNRLIRIRFNEIGMDPSFRIGEEGELFLLRQKAMEDVLEGAYSSGRESFLSLVEAYAPGKDDRVLETLIDNTYRFSRGFPDIDGWFSEFLNSAKQLGNADGLNRSAVLQDIVKKAKRILLEQQQNIETCLELFEEEDGPERFYEGILNDKDILEMLLSLEEYDELYNVLKDLSVSSLPQGTKQEKEWIYLDDIKESHQTLKNTLKELRERDFLFSTEAICRENRILYPYLEELLNLTRDFSNLYFQMKKEKNVFDFDDLEHLALEILVESYDENGRAIPSETAKQLSNKYKTIFVDEYQDTNLVQETIINVIWNPEINHLFVVGDVKQSIYRFRQARPDLFLDRYNRYQQLESDSEVSIELRDNFRSTPNVLRFCNDLFSHLMKKDFGGVNYDDRVALRSGDGSPMANYKDLSEVMLLVDDEEKAVSANGWNELEAEAVMVAGRIRELAEEGFSYKDMVILVRSGSKWGETLEEFLTKAGIPAISENKTGYFQTREVHLVLNYLSIVDNVYQDIPMASVLLSSIGRLNEEELTRLKILIAPPNRGDYSLYDLIKLYLIEGTDERLKKKLEEFLELLLYFRRRKKEMPLHMLLWEIYQKTGVYDAVQLLPEGKKRKENLLMLLQKAEEYEKTVFKGLFYFIRYIDQLKSYEIDLAEASGEDNGMDAVRIMTIHKSKGLEFPVVFVCGLSGQFNLMDGNQKVLFHPELGVGMEYVDLATRTHHPSMMKKKIKEQMTKETLEEELRILYVAMTRAQRKLILTGTVKGKMIDYNYSAKLSRGASLSDRCFMDWLLPVVWQHPDYQQFVASRIADEDRKQPEINEEQASYLKIRLVHYHELDQEMEEKKPDRSRNTMSLDQFMEQREMQEDISVIQKSFEYEYPFKEATVRKRKYSVSELKKIAMTPIPSENGVDTAADEMSVLGKIESIPKPAFLKEEEAEPRGADRGTIIHKIMELLPFGEMNSKKALFDALELIKKKYPPATTISLKPVYESLEEFFFSDNGEVFREMDRNGCFYKELPFTVGLPANVIEPDSENQEIVVVQGVIDACGEAEDGLWLLDYKTDRIFPGEERVLLDRYEKQMLYYKLALEQVMEKEVKYIYIYSFALKKFLRVML